MATWRSTKPPGVYVAHSDELPGHTPTPRRAAAASRRIAAAAGIR